MLITATNQWNNTNDYLLSLSSTALQEVSKLFLEFVFFILGWLWPHKCLLWGRKMRLHWCWTTWISKKSSRVMVVKLCWLPRKYPPQFPKWAVLLNETTLTGMLIRNRINNPVEVWVLSMHYYKAGDFTELQNLVTPMESFARVLRTNS